MTRKAGWRVHWLAHEETGRLEAVYLEAHFWNVAPSGAWVDTTPSDCERGATVLVAEERKDSNAPHDEVLQQSWDRYFRKIFGILQPQVTCGPAYLASAALRKAVIINDDGSCRSYVASRVLTRGELDAAHRAIGALGRVAPCVTVCVAPRFPVVEEAFAQRWCGAFADVFQELE